MSAPPCRPADSRLTKLLACVASASVLATLPLARSEASAEPASTMLPAAPADSTPAPADYDGDGFTDVALKGSNGIWYIDFGKNGFGGRWDAAYRGYGDASAVPVPAHYDTDGKADLAVKDGTGVWAIDFAANGFGGWDQLFYGYGDSRALPVPADYDGDHRADLAAKSSAGDWFIDYSSNGLGAWDGYFYGYGGSNAIPVPGDYDGDQHADLAVKDGEGIWHIDFWWDGFGGWNEMRSGYGDATAVPVAADYDNDRRTDFAVKGSTGEWYVDYANDGFGYWNAGYSGYGGSWSTATTGDYDNDKRLDLSVKDTSGSWYIDYAYDGYGWWNLQIDNVNRPIVDTTKPYIHATEIYGPAGKIAPVNGQVPMTIGVRYHVALYILPGPWPVTAGIEINPDLNVPESLNVVNRLGATSTVAITQAHTRRVSLTCSEPGSFPLGFMLRAGGDLTPHVLNKDYGIQVECSAPKPGAFGKVTARKQLSDGRYVPGAPIAGATVSAGALATTTAADGTWSLPSLAGGPHRVTVSKSGFSPTEVVNLTVPANSGVQVDTPLEEPFLALQARGMQYKTYIDYSRGRTVLHVVRIDPSGAAVKIEKSPILGWVAGTPDYKQLTGIAADKKQAALALINGGYFDPDDTSDGYFYSRGYMKSTVLIGGEVLPIQTSEQLPMLTIKGTRTNQQIHIIETVPNWTSSPNWSVFAGDQYVYDVYPHDGRSDYDYALQTSPYVLKDAKPAFRVNPGNPRDSEYVWAIAKTAVGVGTGGIVHLVIVDGEGVFGGQGATHNQLGEFFRYVLGSHDAINFDGGLSTEMVLRGANGHRRVNTITGEDNSFDIDPYGTPIKTDDGGVGSVYNYLMAGAP